MGKQSRQKKLKRLQVQNDSFGADTKEHSVKGFVALNAQDKWENFLLYIIRAGACLALLTPLIYTRRAYFPFVGPKSLYFMAFCQIVFFAWVILAFWHKQYRPKINVVLLSLSVFVLVMLLSTAMGVDPSRSFWSKFERMTGLLMWLHLFGFFLALFSSLQSFGQWKQLFIMSLGIAFLVALMGFLEKLGVKAVTFSDRGGATLGNTSFLGAYLLFNLFLSLYLYTQQAREKGFNVIKASFLFLGFFFLLVIYLQGARAAFGASLGGLVLIGLLYWAFQIKNKTIKQTGRVVLGMSVVIVLSSIVLLFLPHNPVHNLFGKMATEGRFVNWEIAQKGFKDKPFLGWGPETYDILFPKYFNPCLFTQKCGGEFWFDRTHNIVLDTLVAMGVLGLLAYVAIFASAFWVLGKKYFQEKNIDFWTFSFFTALPVSYFVQNLTVFDMVSSLMMFIVMLSFIAFLAGWGWSGAKPGLRKPVNWWVVGGIVLAFALTFNYAVYKPWQLDSLIIKATQTASQEERLALYNKVITTSSLGKYQIIDFLSDHSQYLITKDLSNANPQLALKELNWSIEQMEKIHQQSPLDYRLVLKLAQLYNTAAIFDISKLALAQQYGKMALEMSPQNQQSYWVLAQTRMFQQDFDSALQLAQSAIDLEPNVLKSYQLASQVALISGKKEQALQIVQRALAVNPQWEKEFSNVLSAQQSTTTHSTTTD